MFPSLFTTELSNDLDPGRAKEQQEACELIKHKNVIINAPTGR